MLVLLLFLVSHRIFSALKLCLICFGALLCRQDLSCNLKRCCNNCNSLEFSVLLLFIFLYIYYFSVSAYPYSLSLLFIPHPLSFPCTRVPQYVSVIMCDLSLSTAESVSDYLLVISGFLVFSESFLHLSFSGIPAVILICIVMNSSSLCSS